MGKRLQHYILNSFFFKQCTLILLSGILVFIPIIQLIVLLKLFFNCSIKDYLPTGDYAYYWHEAATFMASGINGGFYGNEETLPLAASYLQKGVTFSHSILFPALQGTFGLAIGWKEYSPLIWNICVITGALSLYVVLVRQIASIAIAVIFLLLFPVISMNMGVANQEATNLAIGIVLSALTCALYKASTSHEQSRYRKLTLFATWIACCIRMDWIVSFIPVIFYPGEERPRLKGWSCRTFSLFVLVGSSVFFYIIFSSPFPYELFPEAPAHGSSIVKCLFQGNFTPLYKIITLNSAYLFNKTNLIANPTLLSCLLVFAFCCIILISRNDATTETGRKAIKFITLVVTANISFLFVLFIFYYHLLQADRILAPHFILCSFLMFALIPKQVTPILISLNLAFFPINANIAYKLLSTEFGYTRIMNSSVLHTDAVVFKRTLRHNEDSNPWCNTLLNFEFMPGLNVLGIPPGIGVQYMRLDTEHEANPFRFVARPLNAPFNAKYIFVADAKSLDFIQKNNKLLLLGYASNGVLYQNLSSPFCANQSHEQN